MFGQELPLDLAADPGHRGGVVKAPAIGPIPTPRLRLMPKTAAEALAMVHALPPEAREQVSPDWLARISEPGFSDYWTLGFRLERKDDHAVVGQCGFKGPPDDVGAVEIAYGVAPEFERRGYATEAAEALATFAFASGNVRLVCAHTLHANGASARVLRKAGFESRGEVMDPEDGKVWRWEKRGGGHESRPPALQGR